MADKKRVSKRHGPNPHKKYLRGRPSHIACPREATAVPINVHTHATCTYTIMVNESQNSRQSEARDHQLHPHPSSDGQMHLHRSQSHSLWPATESVKKRVRETHEMLHTLDNVHTLSTQTLNHRAHKAAAAVQTRRNGCSQRENKTRSNRRERKGREKADYRNTATRRKGIRPSTINTTTNKYKTHHARYIYYTLGQHKTRGLVCRPISSHRLVVEGEGTRCHDLLHVRAVAELHKDVPAAVLPLAKVDPGVGAKQQRDR